MQVSQDNNLRYISTKQKPCNEWPTTEASNFFVVISGKDGALSESGSDRHSSSPQVSDPRVGNALKCDHVMRRSTSRTSLRVTLNQPGPEAGNRPFVIRRKNKLFVSALHVCGVSRIRFELHGCNVIHKVRVSEQQTDKGLVRCGSQPSRVKKHVLQLSRQATCSSIMDGTHYSAELDAHNAAELAVRTDPQSPTFISFC